MLEISDLDCGYGPRFVLQDINLKVESGEVVGVIGPNGSGKTTLLRAMTHLLKPKRGIVRFEGRDIHKMGFKELAQRVAIVPQHIEGVAMRVEEFVLLGRIPHFRRFQFFETKRDLEIAREQMELTDIIKFKDQSMKEISGGERQLALIAKALTQRPKMLLLDEPTTHLDITHQVQILDLIKRLNREFKLTVIMVLHDLNLASEYCHRLILINRGRIHKIGRPEEVLTYKTIEEVYRTRVVIRENPITLRPYVFVVPKEGDT